MLAWGQVGIAEQAGEVQLEGLVLAEFDRPGGRRQHGGRLVGATHHPAQALARHHTLAIGGLDQQIPGSAIGAAGGAHQVTIAEAQPGPGLAQGVGEGEAVLERVAGIGVLETGAQVQVHAAAVAQAAIAQAGHDLGTVIAGSHQGLHGERGTGFGAGAAAVAADRLHLQGHGPGLVRTRSPGHPRPIGGPQGERCRPIASRGPSRGIEAQVSPYLGGAIPTHEAAPVRPRAIPLQAEAIAELLLRGVALQLGRNHAAGAHQQGHGRVLLGDQIAAAEQGDLGQNATQHLEAAGLSRCPAAIGLLDAAGNQGEGQVLVEVGEIHLQLREPAGVHPPGLGDLAIGQGVVNPLGGLAEGGAL